MLWVWWRMFLTEIIQKVDLYNFSFHSLFLKFHTKDYILISQCKTLCTVPSLMFLYEIFRPVHNTEFEFIRYPTYYLYLTRTELWYKIKVLYLTIIPYKVHSMARIDRRWTKITFVDSHLWRPFSSVWQCDGERLSITLYPCEVLTSFHIPVSVCSTALLHSGDSAPSLLLFAEVCWWKWRQNRPRKVLPNCPTEMWSGLTIDGKARLK